MAPVPPGDETGLYYIIVCGLPWQCSWQRLKDFARNLQKDGSQVNVDHAMVYPDSTDGWVRIRGKSDFQKALAHLNGGVFDHKSLIADGRNETEWVNLRDFAASVSHTWNRHDSTCVPEQISSPTQYQFHDMTPALSTYSSSEAHSEWNYQNSNSTGGSYSPISSTYFQPSPVYKTAPATFAVQPPECFSPQQPSGVVFAGNMAPTTPVFITPVPVLQKVYPAPDYYMNRPQSPYLMPSPTYGIDPQVSQPPSGVVVTKTEARKIIITGLPHTASSRDLSDLLSKIAAKGKRGGVESLEVAKYPDGKRKGHAFVVLETEGCARSVVKAVDGLKWQGRELKARLAKEGVEGSGGSADGYGYGYGYGYYENGQNISGMMDQMTISGVRNEREREKRHKEKRSSDRERDNGKETKSRKEKREKEEKEKDKDRSRRDNTPVVVDGSSGKGKKHR